MDFHKIRSEWEKRYDRLESKKELHRISFILTKKCECKTSDCRHYEAEKNRISGRRINELLASGIMMNAAACRHPEIGREILKEFF